LCLYVYRRGDLFARICAKVRLVLLGRDSSVLCIVGASSCSILLGDLSARYFCTMEVWIVLTFCLMSSDVTVCEFVGMVCVYVLFV
jgi:hypothetical protein